MKLGNKVIVSIRGLQKTKKASKNQGHCYTLAGLRFWKQAVAAGNANQPVG